jgi:hypothetical protein
METKTYERIPYSYEGIEIAKLLAAKVNGTLDLAPKWIRDAIFEGKITFPGSVPSIVIYPVSVPRVGAARDYLMRGPTNELQICPPETLETYYREVTIESLVRQVDRCPECTSTGGHHSPGCSRAPDG